MIELKGITKVYPAGNDKVQALKGIDLKFRESEFVSILGPSGCGKTTLLNIIGGLDHYTAGDLVINGRSTRDYNERDWDTYRNHSVGFVFQSYNLIPHQTVLRNVELALTLSGIGKAERTARAKKALEEVGLGDQLNKRPNEMSGGQMQRVAIARALVNDPDIILADEPTGALDSVTSVQVLEILKKVSQRRLVVMVTHNAELAEEYSTRIVRMLDGVVTGDTQPYAGDDTVSAREDRTVKTKKPSMSVWTAFSLSLKNLFTKKGRTVLTAFAGSIGIIGIALIYAVSNGTTTYIDTVQEETLSSYPLTLQATQVDASSLLSAFTSSAKSIGNHEDGAVYETSVINDLINGMSNMEATYNDLGAFKAWMDERMADENDTSGLRDNITAVGYSYGLNLPIYTTSADGKVIRSDSTDVMARVMGKFYGMDMSTGFFGSSLFSGMNSTMTDRMSMWEEMLPGQNGALVNDLILSQYDLLHGSWPTGAHEAVLVLNQFGELDDMTLYAMGLIPESDIDAQIDATLNQTTIDREPRSWSYDELCGLEFRLVPEGMAWVPDPATGLLSDLRETPAGMSYLYDKGIPVKISGIIRKKKDAVTGMLTGKIAYTNLLTKEVIETSWSSDAAVAQQASPDTDLFTGLPFRSDRALTEAEKAEAFRAAVKAMSPGEQAALYARLTAAEPAPAQSADALAGMTKEQMMEMVKSAMGEQAGSAAILAYLENMDEDALRAMIRERMGDQVSLPASDAGATGTAEAPAADPAAMASLLDNSPDSLCAGYYDTLLTFSDSTLEGNLSQMGCLDLNVPASIRIYASTFAGKDKIGEAIDAYNAGVDELHRINYTDYVKLMMSSITTIIDAITYVLIAFVSISLIVSSIMIGVITLISVQERTKEIGILRAIGASRRNVSSMFNAETVLIGFASGAVGVGITWLLCIPINLILHALTGLGNLSAILPVPVALILIAISMVLTLIAGIIPSRSSAKKDPVVALRTE